FSSPLLPHTAGRSPSCGNPKLILSSASPDSDLVPSQLIATREVRGWLSEVGAWMGVQTMSSLGSGGGGGGGGGALARQGSLYGLTLNEVESHLGEPLWSMNLEDPLRTVLPAAAADAEPRGAGTGKKTVDEVWRDIESAGRGRQPTVGEMTLEDFLSR
uniref:Uncharacterized protein n=1 Tax=Aegilops tauschii subsp. strangulata TaxID=200361 RepID=A0A453AMT3_AEGTS